MRMGRRRIPPFGLGSGVPALAQMLAWFDPNQVTVMGGAVTAAPNLAPMAPGNFSQTTPAWQPGWSATGLNGTPSLVGSNPGVGGSQGVKHLTGTIRPVLSGDFNGGAFTAIQALVQTAPFDPTGNINAGTSISTASSHDGGNSNVVYTWMQKQTVGSFAMMYRYDSAGDPSDHYTPGVPLVADVAAVWTFMLDGVTGFRVRRNGVAIGAGHAPPFTGGVTTAQDLIGIGGQCDEQAGLFADQDFCGNVGTTLLFQGILAPSALAYWEHYVKTKTGL